MSQESTNRLLIDHNLVKKKFLIGSDDGGFSREVLGLKLCLNRGLLVPRLISTHEADSYHIVIMSNIRGRPASSNEERGCLAFAYGTELKKMHSIVGSGFGEPYARNFYSDWSVFIDAELSSLESISLTMTDELLKSNIQYLLLKINSIKEQLNYSGDPALLHGDPNSGNILINSNAELAGIVDFEFIKFGDPHYDLGMFWVFHSRWGVEVIDAFLEGYSGGSGDVTQLRIYMNSYALFCLARMACIFYIERGSVPESVRTLFGSVY